MASRLRAKFTPKFTKFKNKDGTYIHQADYPQKAAEYLSTIQWGGSFSSTSFPPQPSRENIPLQNGSYVVDESPFTLNELDYVCRRIKYLKTPGHDGVPGELFKWLDKDNKYLILNAANKCLEGGEVPEQILKAVVVSIYKKGDSTSLIDRFHC